MTAKEYLEKNLGGLALSKSHNKAIKIKAMVDIGLIPVLQELIEDYTDMAETDNELWQAKGIVRALGDIRALNQYALMSQDEESKKTK